MPHEFIDVTDSPGIVAPYPEVVASFEALGWERLGLVALRLDDRDFEQMVADYAPDARRELERRHPDVATVLVSPDRTTVADVAWFWDSPSVRLSSVSADGALVETVREWNHRPPWPRQLARAHRSMDVREEIERASVPAGGRSVRCVRHDDPSAVSGVAALAAEHRRHVDDLTGARGPTAWTPAPGPSPEPLRRFTRLTDVIELRRRAHAHAHAVALVARAATSWAIWLVALLVGGACLGVGGVLVGSWPLGVALAVVGVAVTGRAVRPHLALRMAYVRVIRPGYR